MRHIGNPSGGFQSKSDFLRAFPHKRGAEGRRSFWVLASVLSSVNCQGGGVGHGRGFSVLNLENMRFFYAVGGSKEIPIRCLGNLRQLVKQSEVYFNLADLAQAFPLPWSH